MAIVSVLINNYNYACFVLEAVESALAQSRLPDEIIVVDDGSSDNSVELLEQKYSSHPRVRIITQKNGGHLSAMVAGMDASTGDILFLLDADDRYQPSHIEDVLAVFNERRDVGMVFTAHQLFGNDDKIIQLAPIDLDLGYSVIAALKARIYVGSSTSNLAFRREIIDIILPAIRPLIPLWRMSAEDCFIYGSSLAIARKYYLATPSVLYRIHGDNSYYGRKQDFLHEFNHGYRRDVTISRIASHLGLGPSVRLPVVWEFQTISRPSLSQYRQYIQLNKLVDAPFLRKIKNRYKLYQHYKTHKLESGI
jgi:glycosyltransferase involved in cell wall biosynthesis